MLAERGSDGPERTIKSLVGDCTVLSAQPDGAVWICSPDCPGPD